MPVKLMTPLLPPLKEPPVGTVVGEVEEDVLVNGVDFGVIEVERPETEDGFPVPEEVELKEEEDWGGPMSNAPVWESTVFTFPTGEAWKVYPDPTGTAGRVKVMF